MVFSSCLLPSTLPSSILIADLHDLAFSNAFSIWYCTISPLMIVVIMTNGNCCWDMGAFGVSRSLLLIYMLSLKHQLSAGELTEPTPLTLKIVMCIPGKIDLYLNSETPMSQIA